MTSPAPTSSSYSRQDWISCAEFSCSEEDCIGSPRNPVQPARAAHGPKKGEATDEGGASWRLRVQRRGRMQRWGCEGGVQGRGRQCRWCPPGGALYQVKPQARDREPPCHSPSWRRSASPVERFLRRDCCSLLADQGRPSTHHPQRPRGAREPGSDR